MDGADRLKKPDRGCLFGFLPDTGQVAQLVEHVTENHGVGGSIPSLATRGGAFRGAPAEFPGINSPP